MIALTAIAAMNRMPKYVLSSAPVDLTWQNSRSIGGNVPRALTDLKDRSDGELVVFGSGTLVRGLAGKDLVDECGLQFFPVVLGAGKRLFDERGHLARFRLTDSFAAPSGVVIRTYTRDKSA